MHADRKTDYVIYLCAACAAFSAIAYELLLASYATFLMGATIFQYSLVISFMMGSMGLGALLVQYQRKSPHQLFIMIELVLAWIAMIAVPLLYFVFATRAGTRLILLFFVGLTGLGIGMEIPLLGHIQRKTETSRILFFDYLGGFLGGVLFPLLLLPKLGFFKMSALLSFISCIAGGTFFWGMRKHLGKSAPLFLFLIVFSAIAAIVYFGFAEIIRYQMELKLFGIQRST